MIIGQNTANIYEFFVTDGNGDVIDIELLQEVEFCFDEKNSKHQVIKYWNREGSGEVEYDSNLACFYVPLTQEETVHFNYQIPVQLRVKYTDGVIDLSDTEFWSVNTSLSKEVM